MLACKLTISQHGYLYICTSNPVVSQEKFMGKFEWQDGLKEKIDALCAIFPPVIKDRWRNRLIYNTEKLAAYEGLTSVTEDVFWRSVRRSLPRWV